MNAGFQTLRVWQQARQIVRVIYTMTASFPAHELHAMTSQMRRAATSIAANIAEGYARRSALDKARFLAHSQGSLNELCSFVILARDLGHAREDKDTDDLLDIAGATLTAYANGIARSAAASSPGRRPAEEKPLRATTTTTTTTGEP